MSLIHRSAAAAAHLLGRGGLEVRRHPAARRQKILAKHDVDLVIDVGAAGGGYGRSLRDFGWSGRIESFEPLAGAFARLQKVAADDPLWNVYPHALGREAGEARINIASNSDSSSLLPMLDAHRDAAPQVTYIGEETITVRRLDDVAASFGSRRMFLKVDTQGFERDVLAGADQTLAHCVGLQLELSFVPLYAGGMLADEAIGWAYDRGFHMVGVEQGYAAPDGELLQVDAVFVRNHREGELPV